MILVDNVRDDNYNDLNNSQGLSYIAGFFSSTINTVVDRNVMTVDSYDWCWRLPGRSAGRLRPRPAWRARGYLVAPGVTSPLS